MAGGGRKQLCRRLGPGAPAWMILRGICRLRNMREISRKNSELLFTKLNMHFCRVLSRTFAYIQKTRVHSRTFAYIGKCGFRALPHILVIWRVHLRTTSAWPFSRVHSRTMACLKTSRTFAYICVHSRACSFCDIHQPCNRRQPPRSRRFLALPA